jgi:hypothetical protein
MDALTRLTDQVLGYIDTRKKFVEAGRETPELAYVLCEKFCTGAVLAVQAFVGEDAAARLLRIVHAELDNIDPHWRENSERRRGARPAGLACPNQTAGVIPQTRPLDQQLSHNDTVRMFTSGTPARSASPSDKAPGRYGS